MVHDAQQGKCNTGAWLLDTEVLQGHTCAVAAYSKDAEGLAVGLIQLAGQVGARLEVVLKW